MRAGHGQVDVLKVESNTRAAILSASKFKDALTVACPHVAQVPRSTHSHTCARLKTS
jgi:hypothetical protein